jgi:hypothetical protein
MPGQGTLGGILHLQAPDRPPQGWSRDRDPGMIEAGNVDLYAQPSVENEDGSFSTVHSAGFEMETDDGRVVHVLVPQVTPDGRHFSDPKEAWEEYRRTGLHLGIFDSREASDAAGARLSRDYASGRYRAFGRARAPGD